MTEFSRLLGLAPAFGWGLLGALLVLVAVLLVMRRRSEKRKFSAGVLSACFAFVVCTSVSLNTSYGFTHDGLGMTHAAERALSCAAFESLVMMCVFGARERMAGDEKSPGWYGSAVWVFAALSSVPAWHEGGGFTTGTTVRVIVGSFGSALSAHAALGLDLKHRSGEESQAPTAVILRDLRERLMARLGLAVRNRTAQDIARERALAKAVELADKGARLSAEDRKKKGAKIGAKLAGALDRADIATDPAQKHLFLERLGTRRNAETLYDYTAPASWTRDTAKTPAEQHVLDTARGMEDATDRIRSRPLSAAERLRQRGEDVPGPPAGKTLFADTASRTGDTAGDTLTYTEGAADGSSEDASESTLELLLKDVADAPKDTPEDATEESSDTAAGDPKDTPEDGPEDNPEDTPEDTGKDKPRGRFRKRPRTPAKDTGASLAHLTDQELAARVHTLTGPLSVRRLTTEFKIGKDRASAVLKAAKFPAEDTVEDAQDTARTGT
ncbi:MULTISPECIES: hypothetical protein [Streptomyces]|uniref:hypothetical protein n=1 Tax=Streptomyces TaxID=1883 RepID=UPI00345C1D24